MPLFTGTKAEAENLADLVNKSYGSYDRRSNPEGFPRPAVAYGTRANLLKSRDLSVFETVRKVIAERSGSEWSCDLSSLADPTEGEFPDANERSAEQSKVSARRARLTAKERATVAQTLSGAQAPTRLT